MVYCYWTDFLIPDPDPHFSFLSMLDGVLEKVMITHIPNLPMITRC